MKLYLLRHPETTANQDGLIYGKQDYPYTKKGYGQYLQVMDIVERLQVERIVTSPLGRASQLAMSIGELLGKRVEEDNRLEELGYGILEGLTLDEAKSMYPKVTKRLMAGDMSEGIPEGESYDQFESRVTTALNLYIDSGKDTLIVTHGGVIRTGLEAVLDFAPGTSWKFEIGNCALVEIQCEKGYNRIRSLINQD